MTHTSMDYAELVKTIRESEDLGRGSCSWVDECLTDEELTQKLKEMVEGDPALVIQGVQIDPPMKNPTPKKVVRELKALNRAVMERM